jgi:enediyne biosynthesis protein E4
MPSHKSGAARVAALLVILPLGWLARLPEVDAATANALSERFKFTKLLIPAPAMPAGGVNFTINPSAKHIKTYLHELGGSLALGDVDGDGLPNDLCMVDIRSKALVIEPVPGTAARYEPFELDLQLPEKRETQWPVTCRLADLNEDGLTDVIVSVFGRMPLVFLRKEGFAKPERSAFVRQDLSSVDRISYILPINVTDIDGDGHLDLVLGAYVPDGDRLFDANATERVVLQDGFARARNGGQNRVFLWTGATAGSSPTVTYREVANPFPGDTAFGWTLAMASFDLDKDGLSDLYIANDFGPDTLLLNRSTPGEVRLIELKGKKGFLLPESKVLGYDSFKNMGADVADINGDGFPDLHVSDIGSDHHLHEGHLLWLSNGNMSDIKNGVAPYSESGEALGVSHSAWAWDSRFDDFDNDGVMELVQTTGFLKGTVDKWAELAQLAAVNNNLINNPAVWPALPPEAEADGSEPDPFWVRGPEGRYVDLSSRLFPGVLTNGRAIATADVDGDGDLDLAFGNHFDDSLFFRNDAPNPGRSLGLHLLLPTQGSRADGAIPGPAVHAGHPGPREGRPALGATATLRLPDGRSLVRQVDGSNGHTGARAPDLLFGLGSVPASAAIPTRVSWRDVAGKLQEQTFELQPGWHTIVLRGSR